MSARRFITPVSWSVVLNSFRWATISRLRNMTSKKRVRVVSSKLASRKVSGDGFTTSE